MMTWNIYGEMNFDELKYFSFFFKGLSLMQIKQSFWKDCFNEELPNTEFPQYPHPV